MVDLEMMDDYDQPPKKKTTGSLIRKESSSDSLNYTSFRKTESELSTDSLTATACLTAQSASALSQRLLNPSRDVCSSHGARLASYLTAIFKQRKRGNTAYVESRPQAWYSLGVYFGEAHLWLKQCCSLLVGWRHLPARSAPRCPEINKDRNLVAPNVFVKSSFVQSN